MGTRRHRLAWCACVLVLAVGLAGCADGDDGEAGAAAGGSPSELVEQALDAREANEPGEFASLLAAAAEACADPAASRRIVEVSLIAERWSSALADGRPKVQAVTESQLAEIDWTQLTTACSGA